MHPQPESTWTAASERCPHPERWHSTDPQSTEIEVCELVGSFVRALQPDYVVETGTCIGATAFYIGTALRANGHGRLDTLETERDRCEAARIVCDGLPVTVHECSSLDFEPAGTIGFAWLDSLTDQRVAEFRRYRPWMQSGTIVGFHDTAPQHGAWSAELDRLTGRAISLPTPRGVTFVEIV